MIAGVDDPDGLSNAALLIEGLNYRRVDSPPWAAGCITLEKPRHSRPDEPEPTHVVFLMHKRAVSFSRALCVRDHLRSHAEQAFRFEETKVARWRSGCGNRDQYNTDKSVFFAHLIDQLEVDLDGL